MICMLIAEIIGRAEGGMKQHYIALINGLIESGHEVVAICSFGEDEARELEKTGAAVYAVDICLDPPTAFIPGLIKLCRLIRGLGPDIVHLHGFKAGAAGRMAAFLAGCPAVYTVHNFVLDHKQGLSRFLISTLEKGMRFRTNAYITVSKALRDSMIEDFRIEGDKVSVIYNCIWGISREGSFDAREKHNVGQDEVLLGTVARLIPSKGIDVLIRALPLISNENIKLMIVGTGPDEDRLREIAGSLGLTGRVIFTGQVGSVNEYYKAFDLFILPSLSEGMGITVLEAMHFGLPVIATETGGIPELVRHGSNGLLIKPGDSKAAAKAVDYLLKNPEIASGLGRKAEKDAMENFAYGMMIAKTLEVFEKVIGDCSE